MSRSHPLLERSSSRSSSGLHQSQSALDLPPMLSPTLPDWATGNESSNDTKIPKRMVSPSLPSQFENILAKAATTASSKRERSPVIKGDNDSDNSLPLHHPVPHRVASTSALNSKALENNREDKVVASQRRSSVLVTLKVAPERLKENKKTVKRSKDKSSETKNGSREVGDNRDTRDAKTSRGSQDVKDTKTSRELKDTKELSKKLDKRRSPVVDEPEITSSKKTDNRSLTPAGSGSGGSVAERKKRRLLDVASVLNESEDQPQLLSTTPAPLSITPQGTPQNKPTATGPGGTPRRGTGASTSSLGGQIANRNNSSSAASNSTAANDEVKERNYRLLRRKMHKWIDLAREKKYESDAAVEAHHKELASVVAMDSLFAYIVGFDYEDRADKMKNIVNHVNSWSTLIPYINRLISLHEDAGSSHLIGLCYQLRAVLNMRIAQHHQTAIQKVILAGEENYSELSSLSTKLIKTHENYVQDFRRGFSHLPVDVLQKHFPKTWASRSITVQPVGKHEGGYRPMQDPYYLPLHSFSSLQEAAAFGFAVTNEWAAQNKVKCDWALQKGLS